MTNVKVQKTVGLYRSIKSIKMSFRDEVFLKSFCFCFLKLLDLNYVIEKSDLMSRSHARVLLLKHLPFEME